MRRSPALWLALLLLLLAVANIPAEAYLSSFGRPAMDEAWGINLALILYDLRHLVTFLLPLLLAPAALVLLAVAILRAWMVRRSPAGLLATAGILLGGAGLLGSTSWVVAPVREEGFRRAAERMQPLVLAIGRFEQENGRAPSSLAQLTPAYLRDVRGFGVRGCRALEYDTGGMRGEWELRLQCPNGWVTLDQFFYRPSERYAPGEHDQRLHGWAYSWD